MRFKGFDLNLLVALDALLAERSVSAAADRVFLSQSAMSGALSRLRDYFGDELLVMAGRRMMLTPRGEQLVKPVRAALVQIETTVAAPPVFDPATCERAFVIEASDFVADVLIAPLARELAQVAPKVSLQIVPRQQAPEAALESGEVDLVITPDFYAAPNQPAELLLEEDHVVAGWRGNPRIGPGFSEDDFYALGHVAVRFEKGRRAAFADSHLNGGERMRRVEVAVPAFTDVPRFLVGTQRIALLHRRLARSMQLHFDLALVDAPFPLPRLKEVMQHHHVRTGDEALAWLRGLVHQIAAQSG